jgi:hypothetical protein
MKSGGWWEYCIHPRPECVHAEYKAVYVIAKLSPDTAEEMSPIPTRATASTGGSKPRLYCHRSTQYIVHYNSYIVPIVLVLDTLSRPCILELVRIVWRSDATPSSSECVMVDPKLRPCCALLKWTIIMSLVDSKY